MSKYATVDELIASEGGDYYALARHAKELEAKLKRRCTCEFSSGGVWAKQCEHHHLVAKAKEVIEVQSEMFMDLYTNEQACTAALRETFAWLEQALFEKKWNGVLDRSAFHWNLRGDWRHTIQKLEGETLLIAVDAARCGK